MSFCTNCGTKLEPDDRFCPNCGAPATAAPSASPAPVKSQGDAAASSLPAVSTPSAKRSPVALLIGAGCLTMLLAVAAVIGLVFYFSSGSSDAAKEHLNSLIKGDVETAYEKASPAFREMVSLDRYRSMVDARPLLRQTRSITIPETKMENGVVTLTAQLTDTVGVDRKVSMRMRKEGGQWLVIAIDLSAFPVETANGTPPADGILKPTEATKPAAAGGKVPGVGTVVIGSGRDEAGALIKPGQKVSKTTDTLSADIPLINHPLGGGVQVWIEHIATGRKTAPIAATIEGEGSGNMPFDLHLSEEKLMAGKYRLVILLGEDSRFVKEFEVQ